MVLFAELGRWAFLPSLDLQPSYARLLSLFFRLSLGKGGLRHPHTPEVKAFLAFETLPLCLGALPLPFPASAASARILSKATAPVVADGKTFADGQSGVDCGASPLRPPSRFSPAHHRSRLRGVRVPVAQARLFTTDH